MINKRLLLVEDDPAVAALIRKTLEEEGAEVSVAMDGHAATDHIQRFPYDLFILDVMLPGVNGMELCKQIRKQGLSTPVLMLTALGSVDNIVLGLDAGADDYLSKPFKIAELLARVRALLRRQAAGEGGATVSAAGLAAGGLAGAGVEGLDGQGREANSGANELVFSDLRLNLDEKNASRDGETIGLTATEFRLLEYLMRNPRKVLSRMDILEKVWGYDFNMNTKVVDVYINYLRKKLDTPSGGRLIHTVIGMGYIFKE